MEDKAREALDKLHEWADCHSRAQIKSVKDLVLAIEKALDRLDELEATATDLFDIGQGLKQDLTTAKADVERLIRVLHTCPDTSKCMIRGKAHPWSLGDDDEECMACWQSWLDKARP
jgi:hypothetical protein